MISPPRARPSPLSRPPLLRMEARDICPRMTAGIPENMLNTKESIPKARLKTALRSVSDLPAADAGATAAAGDTAGAALADGCFAWAATGNGAPHFGQKEAGSLIAAPQVEQNMRTSFVKGCSQGSRKDSRSAAKNQHQRHCRTYHR